MKTEDIDEHECFLGRLVASFQSLELTLIEYFAALISWEDRDIGYIISDGLPFRRLVTAIDALAKHKEPCLTYAALGQHLERCLKLEETRNRYVHGYWDVSPAEDTLKWIWFKRKNRLGRGNVLTEEELSADLDTFVRECEVLKNAIRRRIRKQR